MVRTVWNAKFAKRPCRIECYARTLGNTFCVVITSKDKRDGRAPIFVVFVDHGMSAQSGAVANALYT